MEGEKEANDREQKSYTIISKQKTHKTHKKIGRDKEQRSKICG